MENRLTSRFVCSMLYPDYTCCESHILLENVSALLSFKAETRTFFARCGHGVSQEVIDFDMDFPPIRGSTAMGNTVVPRSPLPELGRFSELAANLKMYPPWQQGLSPNHHCSGASC